MIVTFPILVLLKRECRTLVTELSVELRRIEITFQSYLLQLAQFLGNPFRKMQGVSAGVNQQQQLLRLDFFPYFIKLPFRPLLFYLLLLSLVSSSPVYLIDRSILNGCNIPHQTHTPHYCFAIQSIIVIANQLSRDNTTIHKFDSIHLKVIPLFLRGYSRDFM